MVGTLPRNTDLAAQFELLADLMELEGADSFRINAYRRAALRIRETGASVAQLALDGRAKELQGIGKTIEEKIVEVVDDGEIHALTKRKAVVPLEVASFMRLPGLGPKTARRLWQELGITTVDALRAAAEAQELRGNAGIGAKSEEKILEALGKPKAVEGPKRTLLGTALPRLHEVAAALAAHPASVEVSIAGSARRYRETVRDLDVIATATDAGALLDAFCSLPWVVDVAAKGSTKATVVGQDGLRFDLRVVPPESYGNLLQHFTGSKDHNVALREAAVRKGLSVSEYGITETETEQVHAFATEEEVYAFLGYDWIPPELRENGGELEAARNHELPKLVTAGDLRGDLHTHTTWSDGKDTLEAMVAKAIARGYDYYAICDHSQRLRGELLAQQSQAIDALNEQVPLQLLKGIEVNIRADGSLDVSDEDLATRDWVVASVHSSFDKDPTGRVCAAMENPYVDCIGHLTNRKIGKRDPSDVDVERVIEKALETGTFLEINSQPDRLDLTDVHARAAREAGLKLVIDSDGHQISALDYVELGVGQARRAWLTKADVVNTHTWKQILKLREEAPLKAVTFDLWDTLVEWPVEEAEALRLRVAERVAVGAEEFDRRWRDGYSASMTGPLVDHYRELGLPEEHLDEHVEARHAFGRRVLRPREGAVETLRELRRRGVGVGLITNCSEEVPAAWAETELAGLFDAETFSSTYGLAKPEPEIYLHTAEQLGVHPTQCLFVGDGANDELAGAQRAGMTPVLFVPAGQEPLWPQVREWTGRRVSSIPEVLELC